MAANGVVLVVGATGKQGGAVIEALLAATKTQTDGPRILALVRPTSAGRAWALASEEGVTIVEGDLNNPDDIFDKAGPITSVFSVQTNNDDEEKQGKALIDAAILRGVQHFVQASGDRGGPIRSDHDSTNVKNFQAKFAIEQHLRKRVENSPHNMSYTILRPVTFFENLAADVHGRGFTRIWEQMGQQKRLQMVSTRDIGWFAAQAILHSQQPEYRNAAISLVGDELTQPEANAIFERVVGHSMRMVPCPIGSAIKLLMRGSVGDMFRWFAEVGYGGDVQECRRCHPEMQNFEAWLVENISFAKLL